MAPKINESKTAKQRSDDLKKNMSDSPNRSGDQKHLSYVQKTNLGSFYTPPEIVAMVGELIDKHIPNDSRDWTVLDSSCGYGAFLDIKLNRRKLDYLNAVRGQSRALMNALNWLSIKQTPRRFWMCFVCLAD